MHMPRECISHGRNLTEILLSRKGQHDMSTPAYTAQQYKELGALVMQDNHNAQPQACYRDVQGVPSYENSASMPQRGARCRSIRLDLSILQRVCDENNVSSVDCNATRTGLLSVLCSSQH